MHECEKKNGSTKIVNKIPLKKSIKFCRQMNLADEQNIVNTLSIRQYHGTKIIKQEKTQCNFSLFFFCLYVKFGHFADKWCC